MMNSETLSTAASCIMYIHSSCLDIPLLIMHMVSTDLIDSSAISSIWKRLNPLAIVLPQHHKLLLRPWYHSYSRSSIDITGGKIARPRKSGRGENLQLPEVTL